MASPQIAVLAKTSNPASNSHLSDGRTTQTATTGTIPSIEDDDEDKAESLFPRGSSNIFKDGDVDDAGSWEEWCSRYADGRWSGSVAPQCPPAIHDLNYVGTVSSSPFVNPQHRFPETAPPLSPNHLSESLHPSSSSSAPSPSSMQVPLADVSADLLQFYRKNGYLPAPHIKHHAERLQLLRKYGLDRFAQRTAIDRIVRLAKEHFKKKMVILWLVFDTHQVLVSEKGLGEAFHDMAPESIDWGPSLCAHSMTLPDALNTFVVGDVTKDWRFKHNPYSIEKGGPLAFYASANVHLGTEAIHSSPPTAADLALPKTLPVGSLTVVHDTPQSTSDFTDADRQFLHDLADMVAHEFQLGFEQTRRATEARQNEYLGSFLTSALISPNSSTSLPSSTTTPPSVKANVTRATVSPEDISHPRHHAFQDTARQLRVLTNADSVGILDLRSYRAPMAQKRKRSKSDPDTANGNGNGVGGERENAWDGRWGSAFAHCRLGEGTIFHMGSDRGGEGPDWEKIVTEEGLGEAVTKTLQAHYASGATEFDGITSECALAALLPHMTSATMAVPVCDVDGTPALLIVLTSSSRMFAFEPADRRFVTSVGAIIVGTLLRQRALEADRAKLAFVSQVSHELRSPLYAISSQIELIREFSTPAQLHRLEPFLDVADVCLESLRDVLDDTLDWGKLSNSKEGGPTRPPVEVDLEHLIEDVSKAVWVRKQRVNTVSADVSGKTLPDGQGKVDVILEVDKRTPNWNTMVDVGGMKRVLLNLLGNSLKFTKQGYVKITLQELPLKESGEMTPSGQRLVAIDVEDTGCGIGEDFIRDGKLFMPFLQENPFSTGAGLGMSICDTIVARMGGKLSVMSTVGKGTTIRATLPLTFTAPLPANSAYFTATDTIIDSVPNFRRRVVSDELGILLSTPGFEKPSFDFADSNSMDHLPSTFPNPDFNFGVFTPPAKPRMVLPEMPLANLHIDPRRRASLVAFMTRAANGEGSTTPTSEDNTTTPTLNDSTPTLNGTFFQPSRDSPTLVPLEDAPVFTSPFGAAPPPTQSHAPGSNGSPVFTSPFGMPKLVQRRPSLMSLPPAVAEQPASPASEEPPRRGRAPEAEKEKEGEGEGFAPDVHCLLADDNAVARRILAQLFTRKGISFTQVEDGAEAVEAYRKEDFNLCFLDVQMPNTDGIQAAYEIRDYEKREGLPRCRVIMLSALSSDAEDAKRALGRSKGDGPADVWTTKGGKSLKGLLEEVKAVQDLIDERRNGLFIENGRS